MAAAEAAEREEERGQLAAAKPRADPLNLGESDRLGESVVTDLSSWCWRRIGRGQGGWPRQRTRGSRRHTMCRWLT